MTAVLITVIQVIQKLSPAAPPKILVENYMIEIARTYKVSFEPDPLVMKVKAFLCLLNYCHIVILHSVVLAFTVNHCLFVLCKLIVTYVLTN